MLPLMGFWNSVIYTTTSWEAVKFLYADAHLRFSDELGRPVGGRLGRSKTMGFEMGRPTSLGARERDSHLPVITRGSFTESAKRLVL